MAINNTILKRGFPGPSTQDLGAIGNLEYNNAAGGQKVLEVGRHLLAIPTGLTYTTDASTAISLPAMGKNLAIYNNSNALETITFGEDNTITALGAGATDASGHVGIPCAPNAWTYLAGGYSQWVISSNSTLLVFLISDNTAIKFQSNNNASV